MTDGLVRRSLTQVRWLLIVLESVVALGFLWAADFEHHPLGLLTVCAALGAVDAGVRWVPQLRSPLAHAALDLGALALLSLLWGPHHPLQSLALVEMTIVATVLPARLAWPVTGLAIGLQGLDASLQARGGEDALHLISHMAIGAVAAISLTWFSQGVGQALRAREQARLAAEGEKDRAARLAVVGTLAAGVAHELATPLGSIALLAEEAGEGMDSTPLDEVQRQVLRCRHILDRLLDRGDGPLVRCDAFATQLTDWVQQWKIAHPNVELTLVVASQLGDAAVVGPQDGWRGGLWTLLDNAHHAAPTGAIEVQVQPHQSRVRVHVLDRGPGPSTHALTRAGEPFFSDWPSGGGTGLGLYALRSLVERVGGGFVLESRAGGGAQACLSLPLWTRAS